MPQPNLTVMNKNKPAINFTDTLNYSSSLVEKFGKSKLPNGETLAGTLTVEGISFWDVFSVEFAHSHIPTVLTSDVLSESILHRIIPYLSRLKHAVRDFVSNQHNTHGCSTWPTGKTFLFLGFTHRMYSDVLQPVVARLAMRKDCHVVVLSDQPWPDVKLSFAENCKYQTLWQHWNEQLGKQVSRLQKSIYQIVEDPQLLNVLLQMIPDADRALLTNFKNLFNRFFKAYLPRIVPQVVVARHILENHRPVMVITPDTADSRTRVYTLLCRHMSIPCMDVQFALTGDEGLWRFLTVDCVAVWGDSSKEAMLKQKVSEERIIITGSPRHDCLVNLSKLEVKSKRAILGVPEKSAMVVLASTYYVKAHVKHAYLLKILDAMKHAVFEAADKTQGIYLVVKPHPSENVRQTRSLAGKYKNIIFVPQESDIRELTRICDAFISFGSTATIDALVAGKLTICPIFSGWVASDIFKNSGGTLVPESDEEIVNIFRMIANGSYHNIKARLEPARQDFLKRYVYRTDGMAAARIEALALKMVGIG